MTRAIPFDIVVPFLVKVEGEVLRVYDDKFPKKILKPGDKVYGTLTAGVGHVGDDLVIGMTVTKAMSRAWLKQELQDEAAEPLERRVGREIVDLLTEHQYAALLSFVFNLGAGNPKKPEWTIWKRLRAQQFDQVPIEMAKFVNWDGKKSVGLVRRRNAEIELWAQGEPGTHALLDAPPSAVTRAEPTPPTPSDPTPPAKSATVITSVAGAAAAAPVVINQVSQAIAPYADASDTVKKILAGLALVAAICAGTGILLMYLAKKKAQN